MLIVVRVTQILGMEILRPFKAIMDQYMFKIRMAF